MEDYYETDAKLLKRLLLSCMYTRSRLAPVGRQDKFPFLDTLHSEMSRIEATLVEECDLYMEIRERRPDKNAMAILCGELEDAATMEALKGLQA